MTLGAPSLATSSTSPTARSGRTSIEQYSIYNGSDTEDRRQCRVPRSRPGARASSIRSRSTVAGRQGRVADRRRRRCCPPADTARCSPRSRRSIVVERAHHPPRRQLVATTVVMGSPPSFASTRGAWRSAPTWPSTNVARRAERRQAWTRTVTVKTLGPGGEVPVPGLEAVTLPASGVITIGSPIRPRSGSRWSSRATQRFFVERLLPRDADLRGRPARSPCRLSVT